MGQSMCGGDDPCAVMGFEGDSLPQPDFEKVSEEGAAPEVGIISWGSSCMQGWRENMEDAHVTSGSLVGLVGGQAQPGWQGASLWAVFDGHGGGHVAQYCALHVARVLAALPCQDLGAALSAAFERLDSLLADPANFGALKELTLGVDNVDEGENAGVAFARRMSTKNTGKSTGVTSRGPATDCGATALVCCVWQDKVVVANAGDCRAVLCRRGQAVDLSEDHKPSLRREKERIKKAGGWVSPGDPARVLGDLAVSRAIGDFRYKDPKRRPADQVISPTPEVQVSPRSPEDEFLLLACDGVWDAVTSEEAVEFIRVRRSAHLQPTEILESLLDNCVSKDASLSDGLSSDNMTAILLVFK